MSAVSTSIRLARIDVRRMVRKHSRRKLSSLATLGTFGLLFVLLSVGGGYLSYRAGQSLAAGEFGIQPEAAITGLRGLVALFGLVTTVVLLVRAIGQRGTLVNAEGILTIVPTDRALGGLMLAEYVYVLLWLGGPALGVGVGFALGTGSPLPVLTVPLAVAGTGLTAVAVGVPLGLGLRHVLTRFAFVARNKAALMVAVFVAYMLVAITGSLNQVILELFEPMQSSPTGWFADLLVLGAPGVAETPIRAVGSITGALAFAVVGTFLGVRIAERHWFSDPTLAGETEPEPTATGSDEPGIERRLAGSLGQSMAALVTLAWRQAIRSPLKLLYVAYPLLFGVGIFADIFQTGRVPAYLPVGTVAFVAWAAGVIFTLNPLGDQGASLSTTLLSRVDGRTFVHAHLFAGLVVAIPLGTVLTAAAAFLSPLDTTTALVLTAGAPPAMVVASALSVGIGIAFPRFEAVNVSRSMETVVPSKVAFALFSVHLALTVLAGAIVYEELVRVLVAGILTWLLPFGLGVEAATLYAVAAVALVPLLLAPVVSYRYAVRAFDQYTFD